MRSRTARPCGSHPPARQDLCDVAGHAHAKRALEIAAAALLKQKGRKAKLAVETCRETNRRVQFMIPGGTQGQAP